MAEPVLLRLTVKAGGETLTVRGPLVLWQALLASVGRAPMLTDAAPAADNDPDAAQPDELGGA